MPRTADRFPFFAIALIIIGAVMLLDRLDMLNFRWIDVVWGMMMLFGIHRIVTGYMRRVRGKVFVGTLFFLFGMFKLLRTFGILFFVGYPTDGLFFLAFGAAFLMMYLVDVREWHLVVPTLFFFGVGAAIVMSELGYFVRWEVIDTVKQYWPVALILFGLALLFARKPIRG